LRAQPEQDRHLSSMRPALGQVRIETRFPNSSFLPLLVESNLTHCRLRIDFRSFGLRPQHGRLKPASTQYDVLSGAYP
jgi:hypothetical protein